MSGGNDLKRDVEKVAALKQWLIENIAQPLEIEPIIPDEWDGRWIYLVASSDDKVKLGISRDPDARLASLQSGHHGDLWLLATVAGFNEDEGQLHRLIARSRIRGKWFEPGPWLDTFMDGARLGENAGMIIKRLEARKA